MKEDRQLFVFTCHPYFAREVTQHLDAERIDLTARRTDGSSATEPQEMVPPDGNTSAP
jgi:hypothetical protein